MDEMITLLADATALMNDMCDSVSVAESAPAEHDVRDAIHAAIRCGEEARDRLEEAMDFAEAEEQEYAIDTSLSRLEDAIDTVQMACLATDRQPLLDDVAGKIAQALAPIARVTGAEIA